jgi:hypothetical protein
MAFQPNNPAAGTETPAANRGIQIEPFPAVINIATIGPPNAIVIASPTMPAANSQASQISATFRQLETSFSPRFTAPPYGRRCPIPTELLPEKLL